MTRLRRIALHDRVFFVTTNLSRSQAPLNSAERDDLLYAIDAQRKKGAFWLFGYAVMPTHLHLLLSPHNCDLAESMRKVKSMAGTRILNRRHSRGPLWQPKYFDNIIRRVRDFSKKLEYIHNNPVAAGLVLRRENWHWSSCGATANRGTPPIPIDPIDLPMDGNALLWRTDL